MVSTSTATEARPATNPWMASLYAGLFTAVAAIILSFLFQANTGWLWVLSMLLAGAAPVLGYQLATGRFGSDWKSILGGLIGGIPALSIILWPVFVGLLTRGQSVLWLFLWSICGIVLGIVVFLLLGGIMGQDPSWVGFGTVMALSVWGGTVGAGMAYSGKDVA